jgi:WD40 repeat protein
VIAWDLAGDRRLGRPFSAPPRGALALPVDARGDTAAELAPEGVSVPYAGLDVATPADGASFAVPDDTGYVDVYDSRTLRRIRRIPVSPGTQVSSVALAPDGRTLAATTADGHLRFADLRGHGSVQPLQRAQADVTWSVAFSGDGRWVATAGFDDPSLKVWDVRRRRIASISTLPKYFLAAAVAFSPDGTKLAAAVDDSEAPTAIEILSVPRLHLLKTLHVVAGSAMQFSRDGRLLVFGDEQGRVWRYDTRTWRLRGRPIAAHDGPVVTVNLSPDGQTLATTSDDGTTRLWDVATGQPIGAALPGLARHDAAAAFVDHGTHLVTLDDTGRGYLWDTRPRAWAQRACEIAGRTLTRAEWTDALPERKYAPACAAG